MSWEDCDRGCIAEMFCKLLLLLPLFLPPRSFLWSVVWPVFLKLPSFLDKRTLTTIPLDFESRLSLFSSSKRMQLQSFLRIWLSRSIFCLAKSSLVKLQTCLRERRVNRGRLLRNEAGNLMTYGSENLFLLAIVVFHENFIVRIESAHKVKQPAIFGNLLFVEDSMNKYLLLEYSL